MRRRAFPVFRPRRRRSRLWVAVIGVLTLLVIGAGVIVGGGYWYLSGSLPERDGSVYLPGLRGEVRVYWDERGVPHIEAAHADDLFFAQGYVTAQDRLWQMDVYRRVASGRMAEILGESQLEQDMFFRTLGLRQAAEASVAAADPEALRMAEAYAAGVTAYIEHVTGSRLLPIEFRLLGYEPEPWTAVDTLLLARLMAYQLSGNWGQELARYRIAETVGWDVLHEWLPDYPDVAPTITTWAHMRPTEAPGPEEREPNPARPGGAESSQPRMDDAPLNESPRDDSPREEPRRDEPQRNESERTEPRPTQPEPAQSQPAESQPAQPRSSESMPDESPRDEAVRDDSGRDQRPADEPVRDETLREEAQQDEARPDVPTRDEPPPDEAQPDEAQPDEIQRNEPPWDDAESGESEADAAEFHESAPVEADSTEQEGADSTEAEHDDTSSETSVPGGATDGPTEEPDIAPDDEENGGDPPAGQPSLPRARIVQGPSLEGVVAGLSPERAQALDALARFAPPPFLGSNSWAVSPEKSATGGVLFANDPHMQFGIPALWHQVHLVLEGDFSAIGISVPGIPGVVFGRNERIAWAITSLAADSQDLFIQRPNPDNPREFLYQGRWEPATVREEVIHVKGRSEPVVYEVLETARHGPVLNPALDDPVADVLSIQWTAFGATREINALLPLMRATNFEEFEAALDAWDMPALSMLYADVDGNIGYKATGLLPVRPAGGGRYPLPAWTGEHDWLGTIPKSDMPRAYNPEAGFIVTANNLPVDEDYPYYIGDGFAPWRALRITEALAGGDAFTAEDMRALQVDVVNTRARHMLPMLTAAVENRLRNVLQPEAAENDALELLQAWDFVERVDGPEAFLWQLWLQELQRVAVHERVGFEVNDGLLLDHLLLSMGRSELEEVATRAFRDAVRRGVNMQGDDPSRWQWGRWHRMTVYHPVGEAVSALGWLMNVGDWPIPGSNDTPYNAGFDGSTGLVEHGASWRIVVDLSTNSGRDVLLPGNSGHVLSPFYKDQADTWLAGELLDQQWRPEQYRRGQLLRLLPR